MPSSKSTPPQFSPDERQLEAIEHVHGPMLVIAGAGTGKTTVLTRRIAHLVRGGHAEPKEILALTYTDNAATEMRERVRRALGAECKVQAMTFHAYCFTLLDRCGKKFGVLDDKDLWIYLRKRIGELKLNHFVRAANVSKFLDDLLEFMRRCQDELVTAKDYAEYVNRLKSGRLRIPRVSRSKEAKQLTDEEVLGRCDEIAYVFATVEKMLGEANLGTFGHMISGAYEQLRDSAELVAQERARARFILVDEFQDANLAQIKILGLLAGEEQNVFAVGDPDQAIYRFRGASSAAFGLFQRRFPETKLVSLSKNQRSTSPILNSAFALISKNPSVFPAGKGAALVYQRQPLRSAREENAFHEGRQLATTPVEGVAWATRELECSDVVDQIRRKQKRLRCSWNKFAVIYRNHAHRDDVVEELSRWNIPFTIENMDVLDTPEVRDLLACLGAVVSSADSASLFRVAAIPQFLLDPNQLRAAMKAGKRDMSLASVLERLEGGAAVLREVEAARAEIKQSEMKARAALEVLIRRFRFDGTSPAINAIKEFVGGWEKKPITASGEVAELLEYLEYFREARGSVNLMSREEDAVRLMTVHGTKGLEFDHVFLIRGYSPCFPSSLREVLFEFPRELRDPDSVSDGDEKKLNDEEERRLFYVAMTRARDTLTIYGKQGIGKDPTPAGFLRDLLRDASLNGRLVGRSANPVQVDLFAEEEAAVPSVSNASQWLAMDPGVLLTSGLSATAVEIYELCPLKFKLEREWRIPGEVPAAMQFGATMHRVLRTYYESVRMERPKNDEELIELFKMDLGAANIEDRYQHELYESQGLRQLTAFLEMARRGEQPAVLHNEQSFSVRMGDATVAGRIDRMDRIKEQHVAIVDYKTGKPRSQEDADTSLQLSIYAIAAQEMWGYRADRLAFYNLEDNTVVSTIRTEHQLRAARAKVEEVAQRIAAGQFDAKKGFHCGFCSYRNLCPATEKKMYAPPSKKKAALIQ